MPTDRELVVTLEGSRDGETLQQLLKGCAFYTAGCSTCFPDPPGLSATFLGVIRSAERGLPARIRNSMFLNPRMMFSSLQLELWCHNADAARF